MFLDVASIYCKAGNGGDGTVSWHREKFVPAGGPDGGNGGDGGSIYFEADSSMNTLIDFRYTQHFRAQNGDKGGTRNCTGKSGADIIIKVPCGTVIKDAATGGVLADMFEAGERKLLFAGGRGGRGNAVFATARHRSPGFAELGESTEEHKITLELKTIADIGLIGFPNVGKSTFLSVISAARPKIANYHFTTIAPNLGVVASYDSSYVVADIPGLIEGASEGLGLGHSFLRHVERVRLIAHLVDISGSEGRDPIEDYKIIRSELNKYSRKLAALPEIVIAAKTDLLTDGASIAELEKLVGGKVYPLSSVTNTGVEELKNLFAAKLKELPPVRCLEFVPYEYQKKDKSEYEISRSGDVFIISGPFMEELARRVTLNDDDSFRWFQKTLRDKGIIDELREMGIQEGDTVSILDIDFEYME